MYIDTTTPAVVETIPLHYISRAYAHITLYYILYIVYMLYNMYILHADHTDIDRYCRLQYLRIVCMGTRYYDAERTHD